MLAITSKIICCGADALAATPILLYFEISCNGKSSNFSIKTVNMQFCEQMSNSLRELELVLSPITTIASEFAASFAAASCRCFVALQMVSSI